MKFKNTKTRVRHLLLQDEKLRDCDYSLLIEIWKQDLKRMNVSLETNVNTFFIYFKNKKLSHPESVRRSRAQLQEQEPDLRGKRYLERMQNQQQESLTELEYKTELF